MSQRDEFHNLFDETSGLSRELGPGLTTRIFPGEQAMLSVVTIAPGAIVTTESIACSPGKMRVARPGARSRARPSVSSNRWWNSSRWVMSGSASNRVWQTLA